MLVQNHRVVRTVGRWAKQQPKREGDYMVDVIEFVGITDQQLVIRWEQWSYIPIFLASKDNPPRVEIRNIR